MTTWLSLAVPGSRGVLADALSRQAHLPRGGLVTEIALPEDGCAPVILEAQTSHPDIQMLRLQAIPGEGISLIVNTPNGLFHDTIAHELRSRTDQLRITLNWGQGAGGKDAVLIVEHTEDDPIFVKDLENFPGLSTALIAELSRQVGGFDDSSSEVIYVACAADPLPVGPAPTLCVNAPVITPRGVRPAGTLRRGDTVITASGEIVPVLQCLGGIVPARGAGLPIRLKAPYFGLTSDVIVAGTQRLIIGGSDVEYTFGCDEVLIPARHLVNGTAAVQEANRGFARYCQLILPEHDGLTIAGTVMESAYLGRMRRQKELFPHTTLAGFSRNELPEHAASSAQVLRPFEAITLAGLRAA